MLAWFSLLLFALMGVSALALDLGVARLAQTRLETAAEFATLGRTHGMTEAELRALAGEVLAEGVTPASRVRLGPIGPLDPADAGCPGNLPAEAGTPAVLARRIPLLFGHGSMVAFASPTGLTDILAIRNDPTIEDPADRNPTPVLPDSSIPPNVLALREQGLCVDGRGQASLAPALAVAGVEQRSVPGWITPGGERLGLSILRSGPFWSSRTATLETECEAENELGGPWFTLELRGGSCEPTTEACVMVVPERAFRVEDTLGGSAATLTPASEPMDADFHRRIIVPLRNASETVAGFAALCARIEDGTVYLSPRWNTAPSRFTARASVIRRDPTIEDRLRETNLIDDCGHPLDEKLRCLAQSARLTLPEAGS